MGAECPWPEAKCPSQGHLVSQGRPHSDSHDVRQAHGSGSSESSRQSEL